MPCKDDYDLRMNFFEEKETSSLLSISTELTFIDNIGESKRTYPTHKEIKLFTVSRQRHSTKILATSISVLSVGLTCS